jgi:hypothetical protein
MSVMQGSNVTSKNLFEIFQLCIKDMYWYDWHYIQTQKQLKPHIDLNGMLIEKNYCQRYII